MVIQSVVGSSVALGESGGSLSSQLLCAKELSAPCYVTTQHTVVLFDLSIWGLTSKS